MARLVYKETGKTVMPDDRHKLAPRGEGDKDEALEWQVIQFRIPHRPGTTGRIYVEARDANGVTIAREWYPTVLDLEIVDHNFEGTHVSNLF